MTNKPMLSVEREVIEKALRDALTIRFDTDSHVTKLRALLDAQHVVCSNGILCQNSKCAECGGNGTYKPAAMPQGEPVACMPVDRCYDARAKMIIAFNEAKKAGGDLDDALDAAYKSALRYSPNPMTFEQPAPVVTVAKLTQAVHDVAGFPGVTGYQLRELADRLNGGKP